MSLLDEVRRFLAGLGRELSPARTRRRPVPHGTRKARERARALLRARAEHWSAAMGIGFKGLRIKDQRSRWGSASSKGNLNFNWRLSLTPPEVLDYVVIHELAHLAEMNHSKRFWTLVSRWCPEHKACRKWLREEGGRLLLARSSGRRASGSRSFRGPGRTRRLRAGRAA